MLALNNFCPCWIPLTYLFGLLCVYAYVSANDWKRIKIKELHLNNTQQMYCSIDKLTHCECTLESNPENKAAKPNWHTTCKTKKPCEILCDSYYQCYLTVLEHWAAKKESMAFVQFMECQGEILALNCITTVPGKWGSMLHSSPQPFWVYFQTKIGLLNYYYFLI